MNVYPLVKNALDAAFAAALLLAASPILIAAAVAVKWESPGPALFRQERPGRHGNIFTVYKFRTMRVETKKDGRRLDDFERLTRVGSVLRKTSIDELPQLFNILRGEMSFIGPRPLLVQYLQHYTPEQRRRHDVKPGISGWAQVNGRNALGWEEKFERDVWYVDHMSFRLDARIVWLTIRNVLMRQGINHSREGTMPLFTGTTGKTTDR